MVNPSSISRRVESALRHAKKGENEESLIHLFPALDKSAKKRYPKLGPGPRIKQFIDDQLDTISLIGCNNFVRTTINGTTFPEAFYKLARNPLLHEGQLDTKINFSSKHGLTIGETWNLPPSYILGLVIGVAVAIENKNESIDQRIMCTLWNNQFPFNRLWANPSLVTESFDRWSQSKMRT